MRYIELRRHTLRVKPGQHLSQAGVTLARRVGETIGPFSRVITSTAPRAFETAVAMGFAVDEQLAELSELGKEVDAELDWPASFAEIARAISKGGAAARFARGQARLLRQIAKSLPEGGSALVISHGGILEAAAIGCLPEADHAAWGPHCDYCEGVRLAFDGEKFGAAEILRVPRGADAPHHFYV
jgi:broad specificity phosphatase PhoE